MEESGLIWALRGADPSRFRLAGADSSDFVLPGRTTDLRYRVVVRSGKSADLVRASLRPGPVSPPQPDAPAGA